ncbi:flavin-dependent dehydrogenase [Desulfocapsa sulfexigens DSM 10523]|uniref:Flavin-dependent dehydrogenase n=1 Tax=Desulfocapsa sulfexigens (strain DSM 10523 / SB164P1) TaxID=1167006 RepID=M1PTX2_DESSD|nr:NAD(P)/FAD-dependent oxidoreductase [Desulfocapsa sulfexigens]AGF79796.1 flavin-dependent dehydrogenase [Desulfocapsa sulfexigens DSM 10523]
MRVHTLIIGGGPGGLACAKVLADAGIDTLVLERKQTIGPKVCAGGITWSGLISRVPEDLAEKSFPLQHIKTPLQSTCIQEEIPIIATVNRERLGQYMARLATDAGAEIRTGVMVRSVSEGSVKIQDRTNLRLDTIHFDNLVGADGSSSLVRRHLGIPCEQLGIGINYQLPGDVVKMEWHLNNRLFGNGYAWIFPHRKTVSIGAYADRKTMGPGKLKTNLITWAAGQGFSLKQHSAKAEYINFDFQGWNFGHIFLAGDAAGLASGLTGEGIYPAIISGEQIAHTIINPDHSPAVMNRLIANHDKHRRMVAISGKSGLFNSLLAEVVTLGLRSGMIKFSKLEMAV